MFLTHTNTILEMSIFSKITDLWRKKSSRKSDTTSTFVDMPTFVYDNQATIKRLLCSYGYNDPHKRLVELADMIDCPVLLLCSKQRTMGSFSVLECNDAQYDVIGKVFQWQHLQVAASMNAEQALVDLPFPQIGATAYISVPIKNKRNMVTGILLGLYIYGIPDVDNKTRLLHLVAPLFETELELYQTRGELQQYETRIAALNQNLEIMQSDLKREKDKALESSELKRIFLTNLSQEVRTPMNAVIGFVDLLETASSDEERRNFTEIIKQNSLLTLNVIDSLVEVSKLQSTYLQKSSVPSSLNQILDETLTVYRRRIEKEGKKIEISVVYSLTPPNDTIWNSDEIIQKVLEQVLNNSLENTDSGNIVVRYDVDDKEYLFTITDTGIPMNPGDEQNIFNLMSTSCTSDLEVKSRVRGVGLSLASKYIDLTNGKIWIDMNYTGGAKYCFSVPVEKL